MSLNLDRLKRITSSGNYIAEVDGLRFIAIASVVLMHLHTHFYRENAVGADLVSQSFFDLLLKNGQNGVFVFFAISGFILGLPFVKQYQHGGRQVKLGAYFTRRLTRLEPPYIFFLTGFFVLLVIMGEHSITDLFQRFLAGLTYTHYFVYNEWNPILPVSWSLETEVQFYILAPVIAWLFKISRPLLLYLVFLFLILADIYIGIHFKPTIRSLHLGQSLLYYGSFFLVGFILADLYLRKPAFFSKRNFIWDLIFGAALLGIFIYSRELPFPRYFRTLLIIPLFIGAFKGPISNWVMSRKIVAITGGMCYTMYLLHYPFIHLAIKPFSIYFGNYDLSLLIVILILVPAIWIVTAFFFLLIEKPCMDKNWPNNLIAYLKKKFANQS
mgnify:CR=1 FL=1